MLGARLMDVCPLHAQLRPFFSFPLPPSFFPVLSLLPSALLPHERLAVLHQQQRGMSGAIAHSSGVHALDSFVQGGLAADRRTPSSLFLTAAVQR